QRPDILQRPGRNRRLARRGGGNSHPPEDERGQAACVRGSRPCRRPTHECRGDESPGNTPASRRDVSRGRALLTSEEITALGRQRRLSTAFSYLIYALVILVGKLRF